MSPSIELLLGFAANFLIALLIVRFIYYPVKQNKNYVFTFIAFNTVIFFIMSLLTSIELSVGVGFGLFAIFSVLRYRTNPMPAREMTYLFVLIGLPVINGGLLIGASWQMLLIANLAITGVLYLLEKGWGFHYEQSRRITYENAELVKRENYGLLLADLRQRTGLPIKRVEIGHTDYLKDATELKIFYDDPDEDGWEEEESLAFANDETTLVTS